VHAVGRTLDHEAVFIVRVIDPHERDWIGSRTARGQKQRCPWYSADREGNAQVTAAQTSPDGWRTGGEPVIVRRRIEEERVGVEVADAGIVGGLKVGVSSGECGTVGQRKAGGVVPQDVVEGIGDVTAAGRGSGIRFVVTVKAKVVVGNGAVVDAGGGVVFHRNTAVHVENEGIGHRHVHADAHG